MARGKNATALFEVIHTAKKPPKSSTTVSVPTPKWWAKSKTKRDPVKPTEPAPETAGRQGSWLAAAAKRGVLPTGGRSVQSDPIEDHPLVAPVEIEHEDGALHQRSAASNPVAAAVEPQPETQTETPVDDSSPSQPVERFADRFARKAAAAKQRDAAPISQEAVPENHVVITKIYDPVIPDASQEQAGECSEPELPQPIEPVDSPASLPSARSGLARRSSRDGMVCVDRPAGEVRFRLSYAGLIAFAMIFLIVLVIAFLAGSRSTQSAGDIPVDSRHSSDTGTTAGKTETGLMAAVSPPVTPSAAAPQAVRTDVLSVPRHPSQHPAAADSAPALVSVSATREVGSLYVVIQSYPEEELAQKACDYLNRAGVPCSLVQGLQDWAPRDWYSVVGLQPFAKHDPALPEYERAVTALGQKFSRQTINQFEPQAYTWRADSQQP